MTGMWGGTTMQLEELRRLVTEVQQRRMEPDAVEVKAANHPRETPKVTESLSAFANRPGGGVLLFGLDERQGFKVVGVGNLQKAQTDVADWARTIMEPPVQLDFTVDEIDGLPVMAIEVRETPNALKPCYDKNKGLRGNGGAFLRAGGTDRAMTHYEIFGYLSSRGQPRNDEDVVAEADLTDLDDTALARYLDQLQAARPGTGYLSGPREEVLTQLRVCAHDGAMLRPTLAGLLMFGKYAQEFFPQLRITFVQFYGTTEDEPAPGGARFLDNRAFEGPIPEMVTRTEQYALSAMRKASLIEGIIRRDIPEYPQVALREAIVNAVAHRDYSPFVRGSTIDVKMFADRLEVRSPGGLHGNVTLDNLEEEHSTRNARLMRMMEDLHIVENRGSGIKAMLRALREANLEPPSFDDRRASFLVTFRNHTLMNPEAIRWLNQFAVLPLNDRQRVGLVYLRQHDRLTNADYRRLNRVDPLVAGQELRGLVGTDLVEQDGVGRWTTYRLKAPRELPEQQRPATEEDKILAYVREKGSITNSACQGLLGVDASRAYYLLRKLSEAGLLKPAGAGKGRKYILQ
jgi:ATP-dependent DNA helicase RecG